MKRQCGDDNGKPKPCAVAVEAAAGAHHLAEERRFGRDNTAVAAHCAAVASVEKPIRRKARCRDSLMTRRVQNAIVHPAAVAGDALRFPSPPD